MALSGSVKTGNYEGRYYLLEWTATQSESGNYSTVSWTLSCAGGSAGWYAERTLEVKIAGSKVYSKTDRVERRKGTIKSGTKVINHDDDGNASFDVSVRVAVYVDTVNCTGSKTFTLDQIARRSTLTVSDGTLGTSMTIPVTRRQETHVHTVTATCGSADVVVLCENSTTSSLTYTPPLEWARQNTSGTSVTVVYKITTYDGEELRGTNTYTTTCAIPSSVKPSCSATYSDTEGFLDKSKALVKGKSKLSIKVTPTTSYNSPIASYAVSVDGDNYNTQNVTTGVIKSSGSVTIDVKVTDKRGRVGTWSKTIDVLEYKAPIISALNVHRCNQDGNENDEGEYIKVTFSASVVKFEGLDNTAAYTINYKPTSENDYTSKTITALRNQFSVENYDYVFEADGLYAWDVQLAVKDSYSEVSKSTKASTAYTLVHYASSGKGIAFGGMCEEDDFWCKMPAHFKKDVNFEGDIYINGNLFDGSNSGSGGSTGGGEGGTTIIQQQYPDAKDYGYVSGGGFSGFQISYSMYTGISEFIRDPVTISTPSAIQFAGYFDFSDLARYSGAKAAIVKLPIAENQAKCIGFGVKMPDGNIYIISNNCEFYSNEVTLGWGRFSDGSYTVTVKIDYSGLHEMVRFTYTSSNGVTLYVQPHMREAGIYPPATNYGYVAGSFDGYRVTYDYDAGKAAIANELTTVTPTNNHFAGYFDFSDPTKFSGIRHAMCKLQLPENVTRTDGIGVKLPNGNIYYAVTNDMQSDEVGILWANYSDTGYTVKFKYGNYSGWEDWYVSYKSGNSPEVTSHVRPVLQYSNIKNWINAEGSGAGGTDSFTDAYKTKLDGIETGATKNTGVLTFTGAVNETFDGKTNKTINIPSGTGESIPSATTIGYKEGSHSGYNLTISGNTVTIASSATTKTNTYTVGYFDWSGDIEEATGDFSVPTKIHGYVAGLGFKMPDGKIYDIAAVRLNTNIIHVNKWRGGTSGAYTYNYNVTIFLIAGNTLNLNFTYKTDTKELSISNKSYSSGGSGGSTVSINRKTTSGTNIADITINGTTTQLYAPTASGGDTVSISDRRTTGTKIAKITINGVDYDIFAPTSTSNLTAMEGVSF